MMDFLNGDENKPLDDERTAPAPASQELLVALKALVKDCRCTLLQRESGHLVDCGVPDALEAIAKAEAAKPEPLPVTTQRIREIAGVVAECDAEDLLLLAGWMERTR